MFVETKYINFSKIFLATLSTSNHYRSKSSSLPHNGKDHTTPGSHQNQNFASNNTHKLSSPSSFTLPVDPSIQKIPIRTTKQRPKSAYVMDAFDPMTASTIILNDSQKVNQDKKTARSK